MRILTGQYRGRIIYTPRQNDKLRPTLGILRSSIFDILQNIVEFDKSIFLDMFAGSGAVGLEAASRGFKEVFFIEKDSKIIKYLIRNTAFLPTQIYEITNTDCLKCSPFNGKLENKLLSYFKKISENTNSGVVFLDPPYNFFHDPKLSKKLVELSTVFSACLFVVQKPLNSTFDITPPYHRLLKFKKHGNSEIKIYIST